MRMIPVSTRLIYLFVNQLSFFRMLLFEVIATVKVWVKVSPGPIGHCVTPAGPSIEFVPF